MNASHFIVNLLSAALLFTTTAMLAGCGGSSSAPSAATATLTQSSIQLPSQVQVVSSK